MTSRQAAFVRPGQESGSGNWPSSTEAAPRPSSSAPTALIQIRPTPPMGPVPVDQMGRPRETGAPSLLATPPRRESGMPHLLATPQPRASGTPSLLATPPPGRRPAIPPVALTASPGTILPSVRRIPAQHKGRKWSTPPPSRAAYLGRQAESDSLPGPANGSAAASSGGDDTSEGVVTNKDVCIKVTRTFATVRAALTEQRAQTAEQRH